MTHNDKAGFLLQIGCYLPATAQIKVIGWFVDECKAIGLDEKQRQAHFGLFTTG